MYILYKVVKHKTDIRGYWIDSQGKLYKDNITLKEYHNKIVLDSDIKLFLRSQKAIFYKEGQRAYIIDKAGFIEVLSHRIILKRTRLYISEIKRLLLEYKGLTIFKRSGSFDIEVWEA